VDPQLVELLESGPPDEEVSVMIRIAAGADPPPHVRVVTRYGDVATVRMSRDQIRPTWESDGVISVKAGRKVYAPRDIEEALGDEVVEDAESAESAESADEAALAELLPSLPEDGTGVVVGICDWGIDFTHANFRNPDGSTRLQAIWDQRGQGDPRAPEPFRYGRVLGRAAIDRALASPDPGAALGYHAWQSDPGNIGCHGTHVADILLGNRREPGSRVGLASGADFYFVHLGPQRMGELDDLGNSVGLLEGLDFIVKQAAGRPCVLHLSAGKTGGPKRGTTLVERAVDAMLLENPGVVLVQSVGNYADSAMHTHARIGPDQEHVLNWIIPEGDRTPNELEVWYSGNDEFEAKLIAPTGQEFPATLGSRTRVGDGLEPWGNFYHRRREPNSGLNHIAAFLYTAAPPGLWRLALRGRDVVDGRLHAWIERDTGARNQSRFPRSQATSRFTTNTICNCFRAIAVGAYDPRRPERPATRFSSRGPTADGRQKPEIAAPGHRILAARSMPRGGWSGERRLIAKSGTSMAAPWVSGTVALMHQAAGRPLTIQEVRRILIGTSDPVPGARARSSSQLGYGYLNVAAAVEAARRLRGAAAPAPRTGPSEEIEEIEEIGAADEAWPSVWAEEVSGAGKIGEAEPEDEEIEEDGDDLVPPGELEEEALVAAGAGAWAEDMDEPDED
jgi:subtilisin family serine protease